MFETVIFVVFGVISGVVLGFWLGRISAGALVVAAVEGQETENSGDAQVGERITEEARGAARNRLWYEKRVLHEAGIYHISSPVTGVVTDYREGEHPEIILHPGEGKVYAPSGGKIIRMMPMGNEMVFRTEEGTVLRILVGEGVDELQSEFYRPKVIQNEVVNRGKLLLEFDKEAIEEEGIECTVSVRVEEIRMGDKVYCLAEGRIRVGDGIFDIGSM